MFPPPSRRFDDLEDEPETKIVFVLSTELFVSSGNSTDLGLGPEA